MKSPSREHPFPDAQPGRGLTPYAALILIVVSAGALAISDAAFAQTGIMRTRRSATDVLNPLAPFTLGSGLEFESDDVRAQYDSPLVLEYNPTRRTKFTFESAVTHIRGKAADVSSVTGLDDIETGVEHEFVRERRYRPSFTAIGLIKWPTATKSDIGTPGTDYAVGLIASKDLVHFDLDLNLLCTFAGDPEGQDALEVSLAASYPLSHKVELLAEVRHTSDTGDTETTVGLAWKPTLFLSFEQGFLRRSDGGWQALFAVSYAFGGN
jgi:hypothetical protein